MKKLWINDILETERYILRIPEESEAQYMWEIITESTTKHMIWNKWETSKDTLDNIIKTRDSAQSWQYWGAAIYDKESWVLIGRCGINKYHEDIPSCELWYWVSEEYYGKGIIPECVSRILKYAFEKSTIEKVIIRCDSKNENSKKVAVKCWFTHEWTFKRHERIKWELRDTSFYWILKEEYLLQTSDSR
jgi:ribosomal-protein-alanine N-acetyltransferase